MNLKVVAIIFFFSCFTICQSYAFNEIKPKRLIENGLEPLEKIYLHIDKSEYYAGEEVWFKAYLVDAITHKLETLSKIVNVELISPNDSILSRKTIKITGGGGSGGFKLSSQLEKGGYTIRAYTNYMRNFDQAYFFRKSILIKSLKSDISEVIIEATSKPDIQFFPEGGNLVDNFLNNIGFKVVNSNGNGIDIEGILMDNDGKKISKFKSSHLGMGTFQFIPKRDQNYKVVITYKAEDLVYELPKALPTGVLLKVIRREDYYGIHLQSSLDNKLHNFTLLGSQRNGIVFTSIIESNENQAVIKVPESILNEGIIQFTLLDNNKNPILERLTFYETGNSELDVVISSSKEQYKKRDLVEIELSLDSTLRQISKTNMSIAVTDVSTVKSNKYDLDIKSQLLLNSELKGEIEQPGYYFYSDNPKREEHLDILMLTQGWRQLIINDFSKTITFIPEEAISISGTVKKFYNHNKLATAEVSLTYNNAEEMAHESIKTNADGRFTFKNLNFTDSTSVILQAKKPNLKEGKKIKDADMSFHIEIDSFVAPKIIMKPKVKSAQLVENKEVVSMPKAYLQSLDDFQKGAEKLDEVKLKPVYITKRKEYNKKRVLHKEASQTIDFDEIGYLQADNPINTLEGRVPGLQVIQENEYDPETIVYLRASSSFTNNSPAQIIIDNIPSDAGAALALPLTNIHFIDIIKGPKAAIFGYKGGGGVIAIYTKDGSEKSSQLKDYKRKGILNFIHPGYSQSRKFYEPKYNVKNREDKKVDYRSTIYWNPTVKFNEEGKARVSFYTADFETTYRVNVQGITSDGQIIKEESFLNVEEEKTRNK